MKRRKSRKQLTEAEALQRISHLAMQRQNEVEALRFNWYPNRDKSMEDLDRSTQLILSLSGYPSIEACIEDTKASIAAIEWKMYEDYGRFVSEGTHQLASGHLFTKRKEVFT